MKPKTEGSMIFSAQMKMVTEKMNCVSTNGSKKNAAKLPLIPMSIMLMRGTTVT